MQYFCYGYNKYQFKSSAFGLVGSGSMQTAIAKILKDQLRKKAMAYVDDIIIYSENIEANIKAMKEILR